MRVSASVITVLVMSTIASATSDSSEEHHSFGYNHVYPPPVNFNEIFTNSLSMLTEEPGPPTLGKEEDFHLHSDTLQTQFAEFRSQVIVTSTTTTTTPKPRFLSAAHLHKETYTEQSRSSTTTMSSSTMSTTTEKPEENSERVLPLKIHQRGVLDLIFPVSRVKNFKNVFDTVRRMLSYTFRK